MGTQEIHGLHWKQTSFHTQPNGGKKKKNCICSRNQDFVPFMTLIRWRNYSVVHCRPNCFFFHPTLQEFFFLWSCAWNKWKLKPFFPALSIKCFLPMLRSLVEHFTCYLISNTKAIYIFLSKEMRGKCNYRVCHSICSILAHCKCHISTFTFQWWPQRWWNRFRAKRSLILLVF